MIDLNSELMEEKMKFDFNTYDLSIKDLLSMVNDVVIDGNERLVKSKKNKELLYDLIRNLQLFN